MEIRQAEPADLPLLSKLGKQFHDDAGFGGIQGYDELGMQESLLDIVNSPAGIVITIWDGETFVGSIAGGVYPNFYKPSELRLQVGYLCVMPEFRRTKAARELTRVFEAWGKEMGASIVTYMANTKELTRTLRKRGFKKTDTVFSKRLGDGVPV